jgi:hypothetical protein
VISATKRAILGTVAKGRVREEEGGGGLSYGEARREKIREEGLLLEVSPLLFNFTILSELHFQLPPAQRLNRQDKVYVSYSLFREPQGRFFQQFGFQLGKIRQKRF